MLTENIDSIKHHKYCWKFNPSIQNTDIRLDILIIHENFTKFHMNFAQNLV